jgi:HD-GYP domain-containing protein (c-di-GMP phosphodiesterase class II)
MVADTLDAMTTDRPYRQALGLARAIDELEKFSGTQFDPGLVRLVANSPIIRALLGPERSEREAVAPDPVRRGPLPGWATRVAR